MNNYFVNGSSHFTYLDGVVTLNFASADVNDKGETELKDDFKVSMTAGGFNAFMNSCHDFIEEINKKNEHKEDETKTKVEKEIKSNIIKE